MSNILYIIMRIIPDFSTQVASLNHDVALKVDLISGSRRAGNHRNGYTSGTEDSLLRAERTGKGNGVGGRSLIKYNYPNA
jgi:hypothetical protein